MPAVQTNYPGTQPVAFEGMEGTMDPAGNVSRIVETPAGFGFGKAAFQGTTEQQIVTTGAIFVGVTLVDHMARPNTAGSDLVAQRESIAVKQKGTVWVLATGAVTVGAPVYVTPAGAFSATAAGNTAVPAVFETAAADGQLTRIKLNLP